MSYDPKFPLFCNLAKDVPQEESRNANRDFPSCCNPSHHSISADIHVQNKFSEPEVRSMLTVVILGRGLGGRRHLHSVVSIFHECSPGMINTG